MSGLVDETSIRVYVSHFDAESVKWAVFRFVIWFLRNGAILALADPTGKVEWRLFCNGLDASSLGATKQKTPTNEAGVFEILDRGAVLFCWLGLFQANNAVAIFPLAALSEQFDTFESLQYVAFYRGCAG